LHPAQVHVERPQMDCFLTHTTAETHALIEANLAETPVYGGWVDAKVAPRCACIEDPAITYRRPHDEIPLRIGPQFHITHRIKCGPVQ